MFWCWFCLWASSSQQDLLGSPVERARRFLTTPLWLSPAPSLPSTGGSHTSSGVGKESKGAQRTTSILQRHHSIMSITCRLLVLKLGAGEPYFQWPYKTLLCTRRALKIQPAISGLENLLINTKIFLHTQLSTSVAGKKCKHTCNICAVCYLFPPLSFCLINISQICSMLVCSLNIEICSGFLPLDNIFQLKATAFIYGCWSCGNISVSLGFYNVVLVKCMHEAGIRRTLFL